MNLSLPARLITLAALGLTTPSFAGVNSYRSAVAAEPSRIACFPVDASVAPVIANTVAPAFSGTLQTGAALSTTAGRTIGTHSTLQSSTGRISLAKDEAWNFPDGTGSVEVFLYQTGGAGYNPCYFSLRQDGGAGVRYSLHGSTAGGNLYLWNGSSVTIWSVSPNMIGRLCHVVMVFAGGSVTAYLNGASLGTQAGTLGTGSAAPAQIGASGPANSEAWPGHIDELAIYADPLPAAAVSAHHQAWLSNDSGAPPGITSQPGSISRAIGQSAAFGVTLSSTSGATYRWQRNGVDIPGASAATYIIPSVSLSDNGAQFRCIIYNSYGGAISNVATLTVVDSAPPVLQAAAALYSPTQIVLTFDEAVDLTGATFSLSGGGVVTSAAPGPQPNLIILTVSGLAPGAAYTVTANQVRDTSGNVLATASGNFTAFPTPVPAPISLIRPAPETMGPATRRGPLVISEIMYHPPARIDGLNVEYLEIHNTNGWAEDISGYGITGEVNYTFPAGSVIGAGGYLLVAALPDDVATVYGLTGVLGPWAGTLKNEGGLIRLRDHCGAVLFEADYDGGPPWPAAADGAGHSLILARPSYGMRNPQAWDQSALSGGSPRVAEPSPANPWRTMMLNEVFSSGPAGQDFIELINYSSATVDLSGCGLSDDRDFVKYTFPPGTSLAAMSLLPVSQATLGFGLKAGGDTVYFRSPPADGARVLDAARFAAQQQNHSWGRHPDGSSRWSALPQASAGLTNPQPSWGPLVLTEIFHKPATGSAQPPFVELTNLSAQPVSLAGWSLKGGVSHVFPGGGSLAPGASLAVSDFSGSLSGKGERIRLTSSETITETDEFGGITTAIIEPVRDEVTYGTGGQWGQWHNGGGCSLERVDLRADARDAANWAASSHGAASTWVTIQATGVIDNNPTASDQLQILMLGEGSCLVDDVEVLAPGGANVVGNPGFESGLTGWTALGTHVSSSLSTTAHAGSNSLWVRASGRGDTGGNKVFANLTSPLANGATVTIRARVKWLAGHPEILLRLRGGGLEATGNFLTANGGTPGTSNSTAAPNAGPAIADVTHLPILPAAGQAVTVYARVNDPDPLVAVFLQYRIDPATAHTSVPMVPRGAGLYSADIPAQTSGKLAAFRIQASDTTTTTDFPANTIAPLLPHALECLVRWGDPASTGTIASYRFWMTDAVRTTWEGRVKNSNDPLPVTFVYNDQRVIHNATAQYSGSPFHTPGFSGPLGAACDYDCTAPRDDRFLGETDFLLAGPGTFGSDPSFIREQAVWFIGKRLGLPALHRRFCRLLINGTQRQIVFEDTQQPNSDWIDEHWPDDNDGKLHKAQDYVEFDDAAAGFLNDTRASFANLTTTGGAKKLSRYRFMWAPRAVTGSVNDWADFFALVDAHNTATSGTDPDPYFNALDPSLDEDSWARALALQRITGNWDSWGWSYGKNMYVYKPTRGPWFMTPWDLDFAFGADGSANPASDPPTAGLFSNASAFDPGAPGDPLASKFRNQPAFRRAYWCAFRDAVDGPMGASTINGRIDAIVSWLGTNGVSANAAQVGTVKTYIADRRAFLNSQLADTFGAISFALDGPSSIVDSDGIVTLTGSAGAGVKSFRINGVIHHPIWTSETTWRLTLTLYSQTNNLTVEGLDLRGNVAGSFAVIITVTTPPALPFVVINEWMADNTSETGLADPADGKFDDWFELHNAGPIAVNLDGFFLTDNLGVPSRFSLPPNTGIPAGGHLLVWADDEEEQNGNAQGYLHVNFRLGKSGDSIGLFAPDGRPVDALDFGPQQEDRSEGRYPDAAPAIVQPVPTPGRRNALTPAVVDLLEGATTLTASISTELTHHYRLETSTDLSAWTSSGAQVTAVQAVTDFTLVRDGPRRFWRVRLVIPAP